ncbi:hypothetical protein LMG27952_06881 [Paraburkholderia hiiakae]|uniref:Uracil DNA glycosylase superfamily protein n=1 Tax=Paraburkholderia hiiakae TaxID=1081782 RepID=A0ABN7IGR7_9BURK|nr:hypothetical protein [Paraburkholderia hiiakae]CAD6559509.1 hypothetical protein LMG27952_06881 [Paraburkholderia hiiakae]
MGETSTTSETDSHALALAHSYLDILATTDLGAVFGDTQQLSGLFLPAVPANFGDAKHRVLVVGMETKSWRNNECRFKQGEAPGIDYVVESMRSHARWLERPPERHKFLQFLRQVKRSMHAQLPDAEIAVGWANLFCVSHAGSSPTVAESFDRIQALSQDLLRAHITVTDPDVILFTTGTAYDRYLRDYFPDRTDSAAIEPRCLWQFRVGRALCYRTSHPRYVAHNRWRDAALKFAADFMRSRPIVSRETMEPA